MVDFRLLFPNRSFLIALGLIILLIIAALVSVYLVLVKPENICEIMAVGMDATEFSACRLLFGKAVCNERSDELHGWRIQRRLNDEPL
jgi:hypothetical protein